MSASNQTSQFKEFDILLDQLVTLAASDDSTPEAFFRQVVNAVNVICSPKSFAVVGVGHENALVFIDGTDKARSEISSWDLLAKLEDRSTKSPATRWSRGGSFFCAVPVKYQQTVWGWLVVENSEAGDQELAIQITTGVAEIVSEFVAVRLLNDKSNQCEFLASYVNFSLNAHSSFEKKKTAYALANDVRLLTGTERVSIFQIRYDRPKLLAVSSVAVAENRTQLIKKMIQLVAIAHRYKTEFSTENPPAQSKLAQLLEQFCELTGMPNVIGVPIRQSGGSKKIIGFAVFEGTEQLDKFELTRGLRFGFPHVQLALQNAARFEQIPFRKTFLLAGRFFESVGILKPLAVFVLLALLVGSLFLIKTDFRVRIEGQLRPVEERTIFAPADGIVTQISSGHGEFVKQGEPILTLRSPELDLQLEKNSGEFEKLTELIDSKKIELNQALNLSNDPLMQSKLAGEIADLNQQFKTLEHEKQYLLERQRELNLVSPIDGRVVTWQLKQSLLNKPVRWGEPLLELAKEDGQWHMVFQVPETKIGYILNARAGLQPDQKLNVEYFLESNTGQRFQTEIIEIGQATEFDVESGSFVLVRCRARQESFERRHGARITADVYCGKRSIWEVWTRELWDGIRRRFVL